MKKFKVLFLAGLLISTSTISFGITSEEKTQTAVFVEAEKALIDTKDKDNKQPYYKLKSQLKKYPLYPYLLYQEISQNFKDFKSSTIENFINDGKNKYWNNKLKSKWIEYLQENNQQKYLKVAKYGSSVSNKCAYLTAQYKLHYFKNENLPINKYANIFANSLYTPSSCKFLYQKIVDNYPKYENQFWKHVQLMIKNEQYVKSEKLYFALSDADIEFANAWSYAQINRTNENIINFIEKYKKAYNIDDAFLSIMNVYLNSDYDMAIDFWKSFTGKKYLTHKTILSINKNIALKLARAFDIKAIGYLNNIQNSQMDTVLWEWRLRTAIRWSNWASLTNFIAVMPKELQDKVDWKFWNAYAFSKLGNEQKANEIYNSIKNDRNFYSFLASDALHEKYYINETFSKADNSEILKMKKNPQVLQTELLYYLDRKNLAESVWKNSIWSWKNTDSLAASKIARNFKATGLSILAISRAGKYGNLTDFYPAIHLNTLKDFTEKSDISLAWTLGLIRQESLDMPYAESYAGALGYMQLLPTTAYTVATREKIPYTGASDLKIGIKNLEIGTAYLGFLSKLLDNNAVLVTASYNAGIGNVTRKWLPEKELSTLQWLETVPFLETRKYMQKVFKNMVIYENVHLNNPDFNLTDFITSQKTVKKLDRKI